MAAHLAQTGKSKIGINHGRPLVVAKDTGKAREGRAATLAPCEMRAQRATKEDIRMAIDGARLLIVVRIFLVKKTLLRRPFSKVAMMYVVEAHVMVRSALGWGERESDKKRFSEQGTTALSAQNKKNETNLGKGRGWIGKGSSNI